MRKEIGKRILEIRKNSNMNKEQFAKLIGISGQYLGTVEAGVHGLSLDSIMTLCEKTNTSADYLLFGKENLSIESLKTIFIGIEEEQINSAFKSLQNIAQFIKDTEKDTEQTG